MITAKTQIGNRKVTRSILDLKDFVILITQAKRKHNNRFMKAYLKYIVSIFYLLILNMSIHAQVSSLENAIKQFELGKLLAAKTSIDSYLNNGTNRNNIKALYYKGLIYEDLFHSELSLPAKSTLLTQSAMAYHNAYVSNEVFSQRKSLNEKHQFIRDPLFAQAVKNYSAQKYQVALEQFETCMLVKQDRNEIDTICIFNAAICHQVLGNMARSIELYEKCKALKYQEEVASEVLITLYQETNQYDKALSLLNSALAKHPENIDLIAAAINIYLYNSDFDNALTYLNKALARYPNRIDLLLARASTHQNLSNYLISIADYQTILEIAPNHPQGNLYLGTLLFQMGVNYLREAQPGNDDATNNQLNQKGKSYMQRAKPYLEQAQQLIPANGDIPKYLIEIDKVLKQ